jgi:N-acetylglucosamine-6-phosphate deacetylase
LNARSVWAARAITPEGEAERVRVRVEAGRIVEVRPGVAPEADDEVFEGATLTPGLVDLQVNGADGVAYDAADRDARARATRFHLLRGTTSLLATLVSAPLEPLLSALERLAGDVDPAGPVVGVHLEGPFLSAAKVGAHDRGALCDPTPERVARVLERGRGAISMITLAPERPCALEAIERFSQAGVVVAAGHSVATSEQLRRAIDRGLSFVTHVGNASDWPSRPFDPALGYRRSEAGVVGTFLIEQRLRGSLILDGRHLLPELGRAIVELRGPDCVALVSDATAAAGLLPGRYSLGGLDLEVHPGGYATSGQGLAGSVVPLIEALRVAVSEAGIPLPAAVRMASQTPASIVGLERRKGQVAAGFDADLLLLDPEIQPVAVYRGGERLPATPAS